MAPDVDRDDDINWTPGSIALSIFLFIITGSAEIGGGWLVWQAVKVQEEQHRRYIYGVLGSLTLVLYGFLPTLQPALDSFGRAYAVYGGFFILLSFLAGWVLDGDRPDLGDVLGGIVALVGVMIVLFWPRSNQSSGGD